MYKSNTSGFHELREYLDNKYLDKTAKYDIIL